MKGLEDIDIDELDWVSILLYTVILPLPTFKKGKMKGLEDIDINELDWVSILSHTGNLPLAKFKKGKMIIFFITNMVLEEFKGTVPRKSV
jgi:hypothetical protein